MKALGRGLLEEEKAIIYQKFVKKFKLVKLVSLETIKQRIKRLLK